MSARQLHGVWFEDYLIKKYPSRFMKGHCSKCLDKNNAEFDLWDNEFNIHCSCKYNVFKLSSSITHGNLDTQIKKNEDFMIIAAWSLPGLKVKERMCEEAIHLIDIQRVTAAEWSSIWPTIEKFNEIDGIFQAKRKESRLFHSFDYDEQWITEDFNFIKQELTVSLLGEPDPKRGHNQSKSRKDGKITDKKSAIAQWRFQAIQKRWQLLKTGISITREEYGI